MTRRLSRSADERLEVNSILLLWQGIEIIIAPLERLARSRYPGELRTRIASSGSSHVWTPPSLQEESLGQAAHDRVLTCVRPYHCGDCHMPRRNKSAPRGRLGTGTSHD